MRTYPQSVQELGSIARWTVGEDRGLTPDECGTIFTMGGCGLMAAALTEATDWPVVAVGEVECHDYYAYEDGCGRAECFSGWHGAGEDVWCGCMVAHFYVRTPSGMLLDVMGEHDPEAMDWGVLRDVPCHPYCGEDDVMAMDAEEYLGSAAYEDQQNLLDLVQGPDTRADASPEPF